MCSVPSHSSKPKLIFTYPILLCSILIVALVPNQRRLYERETLLYVVRVRLYMCVCYEGQNVKYTSPVYLCESEWRNELVLENSQIFFVLQHGIREGVTGGGDCWR
jgi:hypothetical protein